MHFAPPSASDDWTVFVVAEDSDFCDMLTLALGYRGFGLRRYACRRDFLADWRPAWHGCVLSSVALPDGSGLDFLVAGPPPNGKSAPQKPPLAGRTANLPVALPVPIALPVILLADKMDGAMIRRAFLGGAIDVLPTPVNIDELMLAIGRAMTATLARRTEQENGGAQQGRIERLTPRESEVATLVRQGHDNHRVGERLGISHRTVEVHKTRLMRKLGIQSLAELISLPLTSAARSRNRQKNELILRK